MATPQDVIDNAGHHVTAEEPTTSEPHWVFTSHPVAPGTRAVINGRITRTPSDFIDAYDSADAVQFSERLETSATPTAEQVLAISGRLHAQLATAREARRADYRAECTSWLNQALALSGNQTYATQWQDALCAADLDSSECPDTQSEFPLLIVSHDGTPQAVTRTVPWSGERLKVTVETLAH